MPPARTGVADYSAVMVAELRRQGCDVRINSDGEVNVYHIGNNPLHRAIHEQALRRPGIALIHDAVLHHFHLGFGDEQRYVDEFVFNYGEWSRGLAARLWKNRAQSGSDPVYFHYPMLRRIVEASPLVIVHNPGAAAMVRDHHPAAEILELPHLAPAAPAPDPYRIAELRQSWQIPPDTVVFGVFGHLRESKRLRTVLNAARDTGSYLLLAGDFVSNEYATSVETSLQGRARVIRAPYLSEAEFWHHAHAVDACINLRYPAAGETSGISIRLMSAGKPVIVSSGLETSVYPDHACLRVDHGAAEEEMLAAYLLLLRDSPRLRRTIGARAQLHIEKVHSSPAVCADFIKVLKRNLIANVV